MIVVAIIGVLVAIAIPIFTLQLERSREAVDAANIRSQYAEVMAEAISSGQSVNGKTLYGAVQLKQTVDGWSSESTKNSIESVYGTHIEGNHPTVGGTAWVDFNAEDGYPVLHYDGTGGGGSSGGDDSGGGDSGGDDSGSGIPAGAPTFVHAAPVDWSTIQSSGNSFTVTAGDVYCWNDNYYIGTSNQTLDSSQLTLFTPDDFTNWYALAKYTSTIRDSSYYPTERGAYMPHTEHGDICQIGDDYYVFSDGGTTSYGPLIEPWRWTKIN